jgi:transcription initiation factor TFIIIB Brf1 subunit/transcription initiation factor TFIIB
MVTRDIYETSFDEDVQTESSANQCPECDGRVATNAVETVCEDCGLVIDEQRIDYGPEWRAYDDEECERTGASLTAARHDRIRLPHDVRAAARLDPRVSGRDPTARPNTRGATEDLGVTTGVHPAGFAAACLYKAAREDGRWLTQTETPDVANASTATVRIHRDTLEEQVA